MAHINKHSDPKIFDICRCCLKNNCSKDISSEFSYSGQKEVYEDMLRDTFNVKISHHTFGELKASRRICEDCIVWLRDATAFKAMVLKSEAGFYDYMERLLHPGKDASTRDNGEGDMESDKSDDSVSEDMHSEENKRDDSSDDEVLSTVKRRIGKGSNSSKKRPKHEKYKTKKDEIHYDTRSEVMKIIERRGDGPILRQNSLKLLLNSTLCVFQWNQSRYRCFCCQEPFDDIDALREHNNTHNIENIERKIIAQQNKLVKVEISILFCKLCNEKIKDLSSLKIHLSTEHGVAFDSKEHLLVPFRIQSGGFKCQICFESFDIFRLLNIHMNKHYQKQVCHICGAGFSNLVFLNLHKTRSHRPLKCEQCGISFTLRVDKKQHEISVHGIKFERKLRFPCPYCSERFYQENLRVLHLVEKHGMKKPNYSCDMCQKPFVTRSLLNNHIKIVHKKEKNQECDICHHLFYTKSDLTRHRVIHTGEKKYCCSVCNTNFASRDSLRRHMKRTHTEN